MRAGFGKGMGGELQGYAGVCKPWQGYARVNENSENFEHPTSDSEHPVANWLFREKPGVRALRQQCPTGWVGKGFDDEEEDERCKPWQAYARVF
jgi:hypothetical protein